MLVYLLVLAGPVLVLGGFSPLVQFSSERIVITVDRHYLHVEGFYTYFNHLPFPLPLGLSCPTPTGDGLSPAEDLVVERLPLYPSEPSWLLPIREIGGTAYFDATIPARKSLTLRVYYRQRHHGNTGRYLLTTTAAWKQALKRGRYEVHFVEGNLTGSNYPLEAIAGRKQSYFFERVGFLPREDWFFRFSLIGGSA